MRSPLLILPIVFLSAAPMWADSVTLVSGEKISGTIKSETASEITIDVPVSASITDERVIRKDDIAKIDKEQPDQIAYQQLIAVQPNTQTSYSSQTYEQILAALNAFQTKYPTSSYLPEIIKLTTQFQEEKKRVDAGQLKYQGQWLSREEAARRRIQIMGLQYYTAMQQQAASGDLLGALQTFAALERDYNTTRSYPVAVSLAVQVLARFKQDLDVRMEQVKADQDQLKKTIDFTAEPEKSSIVAAAKAEQDRATAAVNAAVTSGAKWTPLIPRSQISIETLQKTVASESSRLSTVPVGPMNQSLAKVDQARNAIAGGDLKSADALLKDATALWAQNEAAHYWGDQLKEKMASPSPTAVPATTPKPLPTVPPRAASQPVNMAAAPVQVPTASETPFYMTIPGAIGIAAGVLVVGGIAASVAQKRARRAAGAE